MTPHDWIAVVSIAVSALLALAPWMFMVHAKLAVIAARMVDLSAKVDQLAETAQRLWTHSAEHEARLEAHEAELGHVAERLREVA